jgi:hypothetical protein
MFVDMFLKMNPTNITIVIKASKLGKVHVLNCDWVKVWLGGPKVTSKSPHVFYIS